MIIYNKINSIADIKDMLRNAIKIFQNNHIANLRFKTRKNYKYILGTLLLSRIPDNIMLNDITPELLRPVIYDTRFSVNTNNRNYKVLHCFFRWCVDNNFIKENPLKKIKNVRPFFRNPKPPSIEEINLLLSRLPSLYSDIMYLMLYTGVRVGEILPSFYNDIQVPPIYDSSGHNLRIFRSKTMEFAEIPLPRFNSRIADIIVRYINNKKQLIFKNANCDNFRYHLKKCCRILGIKYTPHDFRRAFATNYPGNIYDLANLLSHKSVLITERYVRKSIERQRECIEEMYK